MSQTQLFTPTYKANGVEYRNGKMSDPQIMTVGGGKTLDPNRYATKKTIAQGMLDIALLTANASQLKYVLQVGDSHEFYSLMLGLIITSLVLQGLTAVLLVILALLNITKKAAQWTAVLINHIALGLNLFILALDAIKMGFNHGSVLSKNDTFLIP